MIYFITFVSVLVASSLAAVPPSDLSGPCSRRNLYTKVDGQCDAYVECIDFVPAQKLCPDGLHYDARVSWPKYPCGYPADVSCKEHSLAQPPKPTTDCPHQYGYFLSTEAHPSDCGQYRMCIAGKSVEMMCPTGLAFNYESSRCDWPFLVKSCDVALFLGYQCPPSSFDESGNAIVTNHKFEGNCFAFFSCEGGNGRLLSCDPGLAFDPLSGQCVDADNVACENNLPLPKPEEAHNP